MTRRNDEVAARGRSCASASGFTLVEIAVVLVVVGLLMMSMLLPLSAQLEQKQASDTLKRLEDAREALIGYALINGRLPCPASSASAGVENFTGLACSNPYDGFLPARTLSIYPQSSDGFAIDAWNNPIRYAVSSVGSNVFTSTTPATTGIKSIVRTTGFEDNALKPDLNVCSTSTGSSSTTCAANQNVTNTGTVAAVIFSSGRNAAYGIDAANRPDEAANLDGNRVFVTRLPAPSGASGGEFDDIVIWISAGTLFNRMIAAGVLP